MYTIIKVDETHVYIGTSDEKIVKVPVSALNFSDPQLGDEVKVYKADDTVIIARVAKANAEETVADQAVEQNVVAEQPQQPQYQYGGQQTYGSFPQIAPNEKRVNKHIFVWVGNFLFGGFGVDRFLRGQIGLGIFKLVLGSWISLGIWPLVDFIISLTKVYGNSFSGSEDVIFINGKYAR